MNFMSCFYAGNIPCKFVHLFPKHPVYTNNCYLTIIATCVNFLIIIGILKIPMDFTTKEFSEFICEKFPKLRIHFEFLRCKNHALVPLPSHISCGIEEERWGGLQYILDRHIIYRRGENVKKCNLWNFLFFIQFLQFISDTSWGWCCGAWTNATSFIFSRRNSRGVGGCRMR